MSFSREASAVSSDFSIDDELLNEALALGGQASPEATVHVALCEYIARHKRENLLRLVGTIDYQAEFDYKKARSKR